MTDLPCPHGADGDRQIFVETAAFLADVGGFSVNWLRDLAAEQHPDRIVLDVTVPPGTTAEVALPSGGGTVIVGPGRHALSS